MTREELAWAWATAYGAALIGFVASINYKLFGIGDEPPEDPALLKRWQRRRIWLAWSEFTALPLFATAAVLAAEAWQLPVAVVVIGSMVSGVLGFAFTLHGLQTLVSRKLGIGGGA